MTEAIPTSSRLPATTSDTPATESDAKRKYQPLIELGRGGMAVVHAGLARGMGGFSKLVVLKTIRGDVFSDNDRDAVKAFVNEARLSARMNHPNVVQVYEVYRESKLPVIVMEYLDGQPLDGVLARAFEDPAYSVEMAVTIICRVLAGLHYAHSLTDYDGSPLQLVHRDVSPHNVMLTYDGQVKLLDFGIAKLQRDGAKTKTGVVKGKIAYMPPEQLEGANLDCRADIFSAGVILWEAVSRRRLWGERTEIEIIRCLSCADIPLSPAGFAGGDAELARICRKAMAANREQRYATAQEFLNDLQQFLAGRAAVVQQKDIGSLVSRLCADQRLEAQQRLQPALAKFAETGAVWNDALYEFEPLVSARPPAQRRWSPLWLGLAGAALTLAATASVWVGSRGPSVAASGTPGVLAAVPVSTPIPAVPDPAPQEVATKRHIHLKITTTPPEARISLDGVELGMGPVDRWVTADAASHRVVARAPGHGEAFQAVRFDNDATVALELAPQPSALPRSNRSPSPRAPERTTRKVEPSRSMAVEKPAPIAPAPAPIPCDVPYYVDADGLRHFRRECL